MALLGLLLLWLFWSLVRKERELWRIGGERGRKEEPRVEEEESETL